MRAPSLGRKLYSVMMFGFVSLLGGLLVAGLVVPTAGIASELAKAGASVLDKIPQEIETPPPSEGSVVLMQDGSVLTHFFAENRTYVPLADISAIMKQAQISIEDQRYYEHGALDLRGTLRALVRTSAGNTQGGSTLTQQYVKLALIDKAVADGDQEALVQSRDRTFSRKLLELRIAIALEEKLTKDEILERYLNLSYYGASAYGVEAAAQRYFGVSAKDLDLPQSAMLAGLVRNPVTTDPIKYEKIALERRNNVIDVMAGQTVNGKPVITREEAKAAKATPFDQNAVTPMPNGCVSSRFQQLCLIVVKTLEQMPSLGGGSTAEQKAAALKLLNRGGLIIQTEIDPRTQQAAQDAVSNYVYPTDPVLGVMVMIEPGTGLIKGVAQSRHQIGVDPGQTYWNYAMESNLGGAEAFAGGSTYKMFVLAAAIAKGYPPSRTYESPRTRDWAKERFSTCEGDVTVQKWNAASVAGTFDLYSGAKNSVNNFFIALEQDVGLCDVTQMARKLGLKIQPERFKDPKTGEHRLETTEEAWSNAQIPSFTLGTRASSPISLANAYATIAARGMRCDPIILKSVVSKAGKEYEVPSANCEQVIPQEVADRVVDILRGPVQGGTASSANIPGYSIAGKTGTDGNDAPTVWTIGFSPQLVGAAMLTSDKLAERCKPYAARGDGCALRGASVRNGAARLNGSSGREAGAGIWKPAMAVALQGLERGNFVKPPAFTGKNVDVPNCGKRSIDQCRQILREAGFGTNISKVENSAPAGTFLGISPTGRAQQFSSIKLMVSSGPAAPPPTEAPEDDEND